MQPRYNILIVFASILALSGFVAAPVWAQDVDVVTNETIPPFTLSSGSNLISGNLNIGTASGPGTLDITEAMPPGRNVSAATVNVGTGTVGPPIGSGAGTLNITSGGALTGSNGLFIGGDNSQAAVGATGNVVVSGTSSSATASVIIVGASNSLGELSIQNGGTVTSTGGLNIGSASLAAESPIVGAQGTGTVTVDGGPSNVMTTLRVGTNLVVGQFGTGTLTVQNGGVVIAPGGIFVSTQGVNFAGAPQEFAKGTINIGSGPGTSPGVLETPMVVLQTGFSNSSVNPGSSNAGVLNFNHNSTNYVFAPMITNAGAAFPNTGIVNVEAGTTILTANNNYGGATNISPGATLQLGNGGTSGNIITDVNNNGTLAFSRSDTFTFPNVISGTGGVTQIGPGTLILTSDNTYTGQTVISGGALQLGTDGTTGDVVFDIVNNSTLIFDHDNVLPFPHNISGTGSLEQIGTGTTILSGANTYTGATLITDGILQAGAVNTLPVTTAVTVTTPGTLNLANFSQSIGSLAGTGDVTLGSATLTTGNDNTDTDFSGIMSGTGGLTKVGFGTFTLDGANTYTGDTTVNAGTLAASDVNVFSANSHTVVTSGGTLNLQGFDQTLNNGLVNGGTVELGVPGVTPPGTTLTVAGNYVGIGGNILLNTFLGADNSPSDELVINGGTATGDTSLHVTNVGGPGAETTGNGIRVVRALNGATTDPFTLANSELRAGDYDYRLFQGGLVVGSLPNDVFLRSSFVSGGGPFTPPTGVVPGPGSDFPTKPPPSPLPPNLEFPIIGPELATYGVVQPIARQLGLAELGTLHQRIGDTLTAVYPEGEGWARSAWGRVFGETIDNRYQAFADPRANGHQVGLQTGLDVWRGSLIPGHRDVAGVYFAYGNSNSDVTGLVTNSAATAYVLQQTGTVNLNAYSGGGYWTHYGPGGWYLDGVMQGTGYTGSAATQFADLPTGGSGFLMSLEGGYPVPLQFGPNFILEPQAQIIWQHVSFGEANDGISAVSLGSTSGATGRFGARAQWTIVDRSGGVWQPYARGNLWHGWGGQAATTFAPSPVQVPLDEEATWLEFAGGATYKLSTRVAFYAQAGYQFAVAPSNVSRNGFTGDLGVRLTW